jgi:hypothetical protein
MGSSRAERAPTGSSRSGSSCKRRGAPPGPAHGEGPLRRAAGLRKLPKHQLCEVRPRGRRGRPPGQSREAGPPGPGGAERLSGRRPQRCDAAPRQGATESGGIAATAQGDIAGMSPHSVAGRGLAAPGALAICGQSRTCRRAGGGPNPCFVPKDATPQGGIAAMSTRGVAPGAGRAWRRSGGRRAPRARATRTGHSDRRAVRGRETLRLPTPAAPLSPHRPRAASLTRARPRASNDPGDHPARNLAKSA